MNSKEADNIYNTMLEREVRFIINSMIEDKKIKKTDTEFILESNNDIYELKEEYGNIVNKFDNNMSKFRLTLIENIINEIEEY